MKRLIVFIFASIFTLNVFGQKIYNGTSTKNSDVIATVIDGYVYANNTIMDSSLKLYFDGKYIYQLNGSKSCSTSNIIGTYDNGYIYQGKSTKRFDIIGKLQNNKIYNSSSIKNSNISFTYIRNNVYRGNSKQNSDIIMNTSNYVHPVILFFIMM